MKDRKLEVTDLKGLKQTVNIDTSDIENCQMKTLARLLVNVSHNIQFSIEARRSVEGK